ncbi:Fe-S-containing hydro-lyase [Clostridium tetani]|uniref:Fumarate hydratase subunit B n=2 Tax=Clostridium tetani TaxID=1513 RepID=Q890S5_CLOTE|nr:Fe-S-containing hydro-lyase [Clostridium tetani]AAO37020.1 fumarate hydratase subunit B [Clostridium tetani E88]KGI36712.1 fumarate hydratase [Clostridium tetani ATCC 9441]KGI38713.1 fumarate hydratase [Clostridium tetani]KGI44044.1 fumarate hydratase [Clostridium tetani]KHO31029.1 fumarate hydratase [Clostridium tetani]
MEKKITTPLTAEKVKGLKAGDSVLISGVIYTSRDAGHKRLVDLLDKGEELPVDLKDQIIYYVGPTPAKPGNAIGSAGPTTSYRMDPYAPRLLDIGLKGMIGKGLRSQEVIDAIKRNTGVYFAAIGGAAALMGKSVKKAEIVCYEDLGAEALRRLEVEDLPVVVVIDSEGNNLYEIGQKNYLDSLK